MTFWQFHHGPAMLEPSLLTPHHPGRTLWDDASEKETARSSQAGGPDERCGSECMSGRRTAAGVATVFVYLSTVSPVVAQQGDGGSAVDAARGDIIVTARKRSERLLDVPVAVSALSQEQLQRYATVTLTAISQQVPQLVIANRRTRWVAPSICGALVRGYRIRPLKPQSP
ncbi:hypothetical protein ACFSHP_24895 [Novosphingobium panipatense]